MSQDDFPWNGYFWEREWFVPLLNKAVPISIVPENGGLPPTLPQLALANRLSELPQSLWTEIEDAAEAYRAETDASVNLAEYDLGHINRANIRDHFAILDVVIPPLEGSTEFLIFLTGNCDWEEEHGLEILLKNNHVISCGPNEGFCLSQGWFEYLQTQ